MVTEDDGEEPIYNTRFLAFATHYGSSMLKCADRVQQVVHDEPIMHESDSQQQHSHH